MIQNSNSDSTFDFESLKFNITSVKILILFSQKIVNFFILINFC